MSSLRVGRVATMVGEIRPPSDKSLTHRAVLLASVAKSGSRIIHPLLGEDCQRTIECVKALGTEVFESHPGILEVASPRQWRTPESELYCGNSGTTMRLLAGLVASRDITATLTGDESLSKRPMKRIAEPLRLMGAQVRGDTPPLQIQGTTGLSGIDYLSPIASAQVKSCVLLAGLNAKGKTSVTEPLKSRDHTERMLAALGVPISIVGNRVEIEPSDFEGFEMVVPADISSAAFFMVAAAILPQAEVRLNEVNTNPTRTGILEVFDQVGVPYFFDNVMEDSLESSADIIVRGMDIGQPFTISEELVPRLIDEIPALAVLATQLDGKSRIRGAEELTKKESNRITVVANGLRMMGAEVTEYPDGMDISGPCNLSGATISTHGDHRVGMAFAIAGLIAEGETTILDSDAILTSYPNFESDLWRLAVV